MPITGSSHLKMILIVGGLRACKGFAMVMVKEIDKYMDDVYVKCMRVRK